MADDESNYKRTEDREWRAKVDHELITLMTGHQVLSEQLKRLDRLANALDKAVRGDPTNNLAGLADKQHEMGREISKFNAIFFMDSTGKRGLIKDIEALLKGGEREERRADRVWNNVTKIIVACLMSGLMVKFWPEIATYVGIHRTTIATSVKPTVKHGKKHRKVIEEEPEPDE